jgi:hypothetical protein
MSRGLKRLGPGGADHGAIPAILKGGPARRTDRPA